VVSISTTRLTPSAFGLSHFAAGALCAQAAVPVASVIATAKLKAVRITVSRSPLNSRMAIHREFNVLSQREGRKPAVYRPLAGKMVNAAARRGLGLLRSRRFRPI
jgi:hypothetical protein